MSRDFELLQRLESGWEDSFRRSNVIEEVRYSPRANEDGVISKTLIPNAKRPGMHLESTVRNELHKLVFHTFLSSTGIRHALFASVAVSEEAKRLIACAADILAETSQKRVCLIDIDGEYPTVHAAYGVSNQKGVAAALKGRCSICDTAMRVSEDLWVIPAGINQRELLKPTIAIYEYIFGALAKHFEYIVVAGSSCSSLAELVTAGAATEGAVLMLDAARVYRRVAQEAKAALEVAGVKVIGSVLYNQQGPVPPGLAERI